MIAFVASLMLTFQVPMMMPMGQQVSNSRVADISMKRGGLDPEPSWVKRSYDKWYPPKADDKKKAPPPAPPPEKRPAATPNRGV